MWWVCPPRVCSSCPDSTFQILMVLSQLPEASQRPSGLNARLLTTLPWPVKVRTSRPVPTSQSFTLLSALPKGDSVGGILRRQPVSVATEGKRLDFLHLAGEAAQLFPRGHVPELDSLVPASRGQSLPIGTERDGSDPTGVTLEGAIQHEVGS